MTWINEAISVNQPGPITCPRGAPISAVLKGNMIKGSLGGETSVLRTFRMSGKELVKERVSEGKS